MTTLRALVLFFTTALTVMLVGALLTLMAMTPARGAADPLAVPDLSNIVRTEGYKPDGFQAWTTDGTSVLYMPQRYMMRQCRLAYGRNSEPANVCKDAWRGVYDTLAALR